MPRQRSAESIPSRQIRLAAFAVGMLVLVLTFATNFDGAFVLDDRVNLTENPAVTQFDPASLGSWYAVAFESPARLRPIPYLTFAWQWYLFGGSPAALHFLSDLFHALTAMALFLLLLEFFSLHGGHLTFAHTPPSGHPSPRHGERGRGSGVEIFLAASGALLWALHPVQTSAVTYLVQRMAVLSGLFQLLALWLYLKGRRTGEGKNYVLAAFAYLCALFSKENAAALPVIVLAYEWLLGEPEEKSMRMKRVGLLLLACVPPVLMAMAYGMMNPSQHFATGTMPGRDFTLAERLLSAPRMYFRYLKLLVFPYPQALDYGLAASKGILSPWTTLASWIAGLVVLAFAVLKRKSYPVTTFLILAFFLALAPESTFLNLELFFEHRLYLASAALLPLVPVGMWRLRIQEKLPERTVAGVLIGLLCIVAAFTGVRNREWKSAVDLIRRDVVAFPENERARVRLGVALGQVNDFPGAREQFEKAIALNPTDAVAFNNLGLVFELQGDGEKARPYFEKAIQLNNSYGNAYLNLAESFFPVGNLDGAAQSLQQALAHDPRNDDDPHGSPQEIKRRLSDLSYRVAYGYDSAGNPDAARHFYETSVRVDPQNFQAWSNLGSIQAEAGRHDLALQSFLRAVTINPKEPVTQANLAQAYLATGNAAAAKEHFTQACALGDQESCGR